MYSNRRQSSGSGASLRLIIGIIIAVISVISFLSSKEFNPVTGEDQYISLTVEQEIALGMQSAPELIEQFGGLYPDESVQAEIDRIGNNLVNSSIAQTTPWEFEFYVLDDPETINAFALPGGPVFITSALLNQLGTEDEVAGVISHEIVHVLARHSAQRIAQSDLTNGLIGAVAVASNDANAAQTAAVIGQLVNMRYGREDEIQSDTLGLCLMLDAGYAPEAMVEVMHVLESASQGAAPPEFFSSHPSPENRIQRIEEAIGGLPGNCPR
jgi:beta-barrel assembly-enhancing protease